MPVSTPCCLPFILAKANQMSRFGEVPHGSCVYRRKSRVYEQYNYSMKNTGTMLQYYNTLYTRQGPIAIVEVMLGAG